MSRTLAQLRAVGTHGGGGGLPATVFGSSGTDTLDQYINDAGNYLCGMRAWKFLERNPTALNFTADQQYVTLPSDFGQLLGVTGLNNVASPFRMTSLQEVMDLRSGSLAVSIGMYCGAIVHATQTSQGAAPPAPRLEIYPTPEDTVTGALTVSYRAGWVTLSSSGHIANIPPRFDPLLDELVMAWVMGKARNTLQATLAEVEAGPMVATLERYESVEQHEFGVPSNGALGCAQDETTYPQATQPVVVGEPT